MPADDMQPPLSVFVDRTNQLDVLDFGVRSGFIFAQKKVRPMRFEVPPFRETDTSVLRVVLEAVFFECDGRTWVVVAVFSVSVRPSVSRTIRTGATRP